MNEQQEEEFVRLVKAYFPRGAIIFTLRPNGKMGMSCATNNARERNEYLGIWRLIKKDTDGPDADLSTFTVKEE